MTGFSMGDAYRGILSIFHLLCANDMLIYSYADQNKI